MNNDSNKPNAASLLNRNMADELERIAIAALDQRTRRAFLKVRKANTRNVADTKTKNMAAGKYTEARGEQHKRIVQSFLTNQAIRAAAPPKGRKPTLVMLGGRPAAGKTSAIVNAEVDFDQSRFVVISADTVQEKIKGYKARNAPLFNQEGQDIAEQLEKAARELRLNICLDATMRTGDKAAKRVQDYTANGYDVEGIFVHTTPLTSAIRSAQRAVKSGRYVPLMVSLTSLTNEASFDACAPLMKRWTLLDNNGKRTILVRKKGYR
jgi:predicted ABC-type ATPase